MIKLVLSFTLTLFFTAQSGLFAQNSSGNMVPPTSISNSSTSPQPNRQYFLVTTQTGGLKGLSSQLKAAFLAKHFVSVEIDEKTSILKIISNKGTKIEDVKAILVNFNLSIIDYLEEYTNSYPSIFANH